MFDDSNTPHTRTWRLVPTEPGFLHMLIPMTESTIAGLGVIEVDRGGRRYVYPADYPNLERIGASIELSAVHDDGEVEGLKVDPETYAAQDAYFSSGVAQSEAFVQSMAGIIDPRFDAVLEQVMTDESQLAAFREIGDHLAAGGNVINAVPHGPLLDIGLLHAVIFVALARLGYQAKVGIVISHGVAGRGKRFNDQLICLADALDWACDKIWYVTPQTPRARQSSYSEVASAEHIQHRNAVVRADVANSLDEGGYVITVAPSATSNRRAADGVHHLESPTLGTLKLMTHPRTKVAVATGRFLGTKTPAYDINRELLQFGGDGATVNAHGDVLMRLMVDGMRRTDPTEQYDISRRGRRIAE